MDIPTSPNAPFIYINGCSLPARLSTARGCRVCKICPGVKCSVLDFSNFHPIKGYLVEGASKAGSTTCRHMYVVPEVHTAGTNNGSF